MSSSPSSYEPKSLGFKITDTTVTFLNPEGEGQGDGVEFRIASGQRFDYVKDETSNVTCAFLLSFVYNTDCSRISLIT